MATISMVLPLPAAAVHKQPSAPTSGAFFKPLQMKKSKLGFTTDSKAKLRVEASLKEKVVAGITAAVAASMVVPEVAQAADSMTPSLKNFLLSIGAGGIVLGVIAGAIVGVSNFDPVKRS
ncbi:hypothetical protein BUALT_Bualt05G0006700 [Buddleja alternifolia]|uniref:Ultraviolet-B-repressible protein n=1 Tax=Buddleja alternifolia TaxID=168488 RepID=A0AAV6XRW2_9LAMI|nr:hypothetical protein BUALT_Bualt05G0006700 [Buddleja alternifolia]